MVCTFFGHRQVSKEIEPTLRSALVDLIENKGVNRFYVGNHGGFDAMVQRMLKELAASYPIKFYVVLAYLPEKGARYHSSTRRKRSCPTALKPSQNGLRFPIEINGWWKNPTMPLHMLPTISVLVPQRLSLLRNGEAKQ